MFPNSKMTASSSCDADAGGDAENVCNITHHAPVDWARLHVLAEGHNGPSEMDDAPAHTTKEEQMVTYDFK